MAIDLNAITGDINFQRNVQRAMAQMRASGSWKSNAIDSIFNTMAAGRERDYIAALREKANKDAKSQNLDTAKDRFNATMGLSLSEMGMRRAAIDEQRKDTRAANLLSGLGVIASGASAYKNYQDNQKLANELIGLRRLYSPSVI